MLSPNVRGANLRAEGKVMHPDRPIVRNRK
jgi:hypothetical protein